MTTAEQQLLEILHTKGALDEVKRKRLLDAYIEASSPPKMSYEEFLKWADGKHTEWVKGMVILMSPVSFFHQNIIEFLIAILRPFVEKWQLGLILAAPYQMRLEESGREPDLMFIRQENLSRITKNYLNGGADLVIEVISPESINRDRGEKFYEYEKAGIPEYWLIDPIRQEPEFYHLDARGRYQLVRPNEDGLYFSKILTGLELPVSWLFEPPPVIEALRTLGIIP